MKRTALSIVVAGAALSVAVLAQAPAPAAPAPPATPGAGQVPAAKHEAGYTTLFNRKDLTGWKVGGPASDFKVVDGAIQANGVDGPGHVFYEGDVHNHTFRNFDLKLDVMAKHRSNGGVYVLTEFQDKGFPGKGFEIQVNNSHTDRIRTGSLYHVVDLSYIPAKDDEWFPMEIRVEGQTITVWVKGTQVLQWTQPPDWNGAYDTPGRKIAPGTIAFQAHDPNSFTYYTNVRIKALD
jgi:hypothetical protein